MSFEIPPDRSPKYLSSFVNLLMYVHQGMFYIYFTKKKTGPIDLFHFGAKLLTAAVITVSTRMRGMFFPSP